MHAVIRAKKKTSVAQTAIFTGIMMGTVPPKTNIKMKINKEILLQEIGGKCEKDRKKII